MRDSLPAPTPYSEDHLKGQGFAKIRNGIKRHIEGKDGCKRRMGLAERGVYLFLHLYCDYDTGVYRGNVASIANTGGDPIPTVRDALYRLRDDRKFINFKAEEGKGAIYDILIDKYEPTFGVYKGHRLNAWKHGDECKPEYEPFEDERELDVGLTPVQRQSHVGLPRHSQTKDLKPPDKTPEEGREEGSCWKVIVLISYIA